MTPVLKSVTIGAPKAKLAQARHKTGAIHPEKVRNPDISPLLVYDAKTNHVPRGASPSALYFGRLAKVNENLVN
jgi:hypothetical protein